jgi:citrate lyase alpha subunit
MKLDTMNKEETFKVRAYGYGELALLYFPNSSKKSASTQLGRWIKLHASLHEQLVNSGLQRGMKILTPKHVEILVAYLGRP